MRNFNKNLSVPSVPSISSVRKIVTLLDYFCNTASQFTGKPICFKSITSMYCSFSTDIDVRISMFHHFFDTYQK